MPGIGLAPDGAMAVEDVCDLQPWAAHGRRATPRFSGSVRLARLSQLDPDLGNFADGLNGNWLIGLVRSRKKQWKSGSGADQVACGTIGGCRISRHVFALQGSPERRQGAPLLERRREPAGVGRADGAAASAVSGRDQ